MILSYFVLVIVVTVCNCNDLRMYIFDKEPILRKFFNFDLNIIAGSIKKCKYGDTSCIKDAIHLVLKTHYSGLPELALSSLDPAPFKDFVTAGHSTGGPVSLNIKLPKGNVVGIKLLEVQSVE